MTLRKKKNIDGSLMNFGFEKLVVYQLATDFANKAFSLSKDFSNCVQSSLGDQFRRSAISIANNIAESSSKVSSREKKNNIIVML
jgi:four helix bundle protein